MPVAVDGVSQLLGQVDHDGIGGLVAVAPAEGGAGHVLYPLEGEAGRRGGLVADEGGGLGHRDRPAGPAGQPRQLSKWPAARCRAHCVPDGEGADGGGDAELHWVTLCPLSAPVHLVLWAPDG